VYKDDFIRNISELSLSVKSQPAIGILGFCRHSSQRFKKPKKPFFANAWTDRATIIQTLFILKNEIRQKQKLF
jgi:hypothetical protein